MPQKRNPDAAELVRAKTGRITGALVGLLTVMKGLPLAYAKDMQEDKEPVFDAAEAWRCAWPRSPAWSRDMSPTRADARIRRRRLSPPPPISRTGWCGCCACRSATPTTSPAAWWRAAEARGVDLAGLTLAEMQAEEPRITADIFGVLTVEASVASRTQLWRHRAGERRARRRHAGLESLG